MIIDVNQDAHIWILLLLQTTYHYVPLPTIPSIKRWSSKSKAVTGIKVGKDFLVKNRDATSMSEHAEPSHIM